jgi:hypothetical protein
MFLGRGKLLLTLDDIGIIWILGCSLVDVDLVDDFMTGNCVRVGIFEILDHWVFPLEYNPTFYY